MDKDIKISVTSAAQSGIAPAAHPQLTAGVDSRTDVYLETFLSSHSAFAAALAAGLLDHLTLAVAGRTLLANTEKALRDGLAAGTSAA